MPSSMKYREIDSWIDDIKWMKIHSNEIWLGNVAHTKPKNAYKISSLLHLSGDLQFNKKNWVNILILNFMNKLNTYWFPSL